MRKLILIYAYLLFAVAVVMGDPQPVWHDPWLNWDFINQLGAGTVVDDLDIWVDNPTWVPPQWWAQPFTNMTPTNNAGDIDGDGDLDTRIRYTGAVIPSGTSAHGGLYMPGSGMVLDAYWTSGGAKVGPSTPVTYEQTRIVGDPEVYMELSFGSGFFLDSENAGKLPGWTNIRAFINIPADLLDLEDLNSDLDLSTLSAYEVTPKVGGADGNDILTTDVFTMEDWGPESFFDVYLGELLPYQASPDFEALLVAEVVTVASDPIPTGQFWNLNPQSPEPATIILLGTGTLLLRRRKR